MMSGKFGNKTANFIETNKHIILHNLSECLELGPGIVLIDDFMNIVHDITIISYCHIKQT